MDFNNRLRGNDGSRVSQNIQVRDSVSQVRYQSQPTPFRTSQNNNNYQTHTNRHSINNGMFNRRSMSLGFHSSSYVSPSTSSNFSEHLRRVSSISGLEARVGSNPSVMLGLSPFSMIPPSSGGLHSSVIGSSNALESSYVNYPLPPPPAPSHILTQGFINRESYSSTSASIPIAVPLPPSVPVGVPLTESTSTSVSASLSTSASTTLPSSASASVPSISAPPPVPVAVPLPAGPIAVPAVPAGPIAVPAVPAGPPVSVTTVQTSVHVSPVVPTPIVTSGPIPTQPPMVPPSVSVPVPVGPTSIAELPVPYLAEPTIPPIISLIPHPNAPPPPPPPPPPPLPELVCPMVTTFTEVILGVPVHQRIPLFDPTLAPPPVLPGVPIPRVFPAPPPIPLCNDPSNGLGFIPSGLPYVAPIGSPYVNIQDPLFMNVPNQPFTNQQSSHCVNQRSQPELGRSQRNIQYRDHSRFSYESGNRFNSPHRYSNSIRGLRQPGGRRVYNNERVRIGSEFIPNSQSRYSVSTETHTNLFTEEDTRITSSTNENDIPNNPSNDTSKNNSESSNEIEYGNSSCVASTISYSSDNNSSNNSSSNNNSNNNNNNNNGSRRATNRARSLLEVTEVSAESESYSEPNSKLSKDNVKGKDNTLFSDITQNKKKIFTEKNKGDKRRNKNFNKNKNIHGMNEVRRNLRTCIPALGNQGNSNSLASQFCNGTFNGDLRTQDRRLPMNRNVNVNIPPFLTFPHILNALNLWFLLMLSMINAKKKKK